MSLTGEKSLLSSLTIRGAIIALLPAILRLFGIDLGEDAIGSIGVFVEAGIAFVGAFMVIYGRIRATKQIAT